MRAGESFRLRVEIPSLSGPMLAGARGEVLSVFANRYGRETAYVRLDDGRVSLLAVEDLTHAEGEFENNDCDKATIETIDGGCADGNARADDADSPGDGNGDLCPAGTEPPGKPSVLANGGREVSDSDSGGHLEHEAGASVRAEARGVPAVVGETLGRCGFRLASREFNPGKYYAKREELNASWDCGTERLTIWGTDRVLTLAEVEAEFGLTHN